MAKRGEERKPRQEAEAHLVSSYIAHTYPSDLAMVRVRLGAIEPQLDEATLTTSELTMVGSFRRWADAIVIQAHQLILIEGAIRPSLGDVSILQGYEMFLAVTPELASWKNLTHRLELVAAITDPIVSAMCARAGIHFVEYTTPETDAYIAQILPRFRRAPRAGGLV